MKSEFGLIDQIKTLFAAVPANECEGIGDDCAVIPINKEESIVITQDMLVERVHFLRHATSAYELGGKSLAVNLSDVAAMGAQPFASLLSIAVPEELMGEWIEEFMRGYRDLSARHGVALIGGDTTASKCDFTINITAMGRCRNEAIKRRSDARVGDIIAVTAPLGGSGAGLNDILNGELATANAAVHRNPTPRVEEGLFIATQCEGVRAMMDISDGVASDLRHILRASGVGAEIELTQVPIAEGATLRQALCSGEDYELLMTIDSEELKKISKTFEAHFKKNLYPIGRIVDGEGIVWLNEGVVYEGDFRGFTHY